MSLIRDFLDEYTKFETFIKNRNNVRKFDNFNISDDKILKRNRNTWEFYRNLRNLLTHEADARNGNYVTVTQKLYDDFKQDVEKIMHPKTAYEISIKDNHIYKVKKQETIYNVIKTMIEKNYTCTPIVDDNEKLTGVFASHSLMHYFNANKEGFISEPKEMRISDIMQFCSPNGNDEIDYKFVSKTNDEYFIKELFKKSLKERKRLETIFVTENGKSTERLLGIITYWDLEK